MPSTEEAKRINKIGKLAEKALDRWATEAGIIANKSNEDEAGWDFLLDLPFTAAVEDENSPGGVAALPPDLGTQPLRALVQVKASDRRDGRISIKLSNLKRLVQSPGPAFYLIVEFDGKDKPQRAFFVHVWEKIIRHTQKRLRECATEEDVRLHKKRVSITYGESEKMDALTGTDLRSALLASTGRSATGYTDRKLRLIESVGYEEDAGGINAKVMLAMPEGYESVEGYLADFYLGLLPYIEAKKVEIHDVRFQIVTPKPVKVIKPARLGIAGRSPKSADLFLVAVDGSRRTQLQTQFYTSGSGALDFSPENRRMRFAASCADVFITLFEEPEISFSFNFPDYGTPTPIADLYEAAKLILFLEASIRESTDFAIEIDIASTEVSGRCGTLPVSRMADRVGKLPVGIAKTIRNAWRVCQAFDVATKARPSLYQLDQQSSYLEAWHPFFTDRRPHAKTYFWAEQALCGEENFDELIFAGVGGASLSIGDYRLTAFFGLQGTAEYVQEKEVKEMAPEIHKEAGSNPVLQLETQDVRLLKKYVSDREDPLPATPEEMRQQAAEELDEREYDYLLSGRE